jgi:hypothetical protein
LQIPMLEAGEEWAKKAVDLLSKIE